jgi:hypothetical protein
VLVDAQTQPIAEAWIAKQRLPVHLAVAPPPDDPSTQPALPTRNSLRQHCDAILDLLARSWPDVDIEWAAEARAEAKDREELPIEFGFTGHNVTIPNELLLMSVGGVFAGEQEPLVGDDAKYLARILESADEAALVRHAIPAAPLAATLPPVPTVILAAPGIYRHARKTRPGKGQARLPVMRMLRKLQQQTTYSLLLEEEAELRELMDDPQSSALLQLRTLEQTVFTDALAVRAASYLCPVLRLTPAVNHASSALIRLADCLRSDDPAPRKVERLTEQLTSALTACVPGEFIDRIDLPHTGIKLVTDAPLELLPIRGLPLTLRHVTSRIPLTPGNQAFQELLPHETLELSIKDFGESLVIRSFPEDDPIRGDLEAAVRGCSLSDGSPLPVRFVDVRTKLELEAALNGFDGALVVFDCHGRHRRDEDYGQLQLTGEAVNLWELGMKVRVPPIAFLCACDTHAYDRSQFTPGSGLLARGARAVISTVLPVHSQKAAVFAARLLFRIYEFLPQVTNELRKPVRWDSAFSLLQRMMFVTEFLGVIPSDAGSTSWHQDVMARATLHIHKYYDWYERFQDDIAQATGHSPEEIARQGKNRLSFPESLKHLHLGNPESIVILPEAFHVGDLVQVADHVDDPKTPLAPEEIQPSPLTS